MHPDRTAPDGAPVLDVRGRAPSPVTLPGYHRGRIPRNKGQRYPADPPTTEEIVRILKACPDTLPGQRGRGLIVVLWRTGLRISEALDLREQDLDERGGSVFVRSGKGGKARKVGMDDWGWDQLRPWLARRQELPVGTLFPVVEGPTAGRRWHPAGARVFVHNAAAAARVRRRIHPHTFRHAHACELAREGVPVHIIQRQLGHANPGITAIYLQGISGVEVIDAIGARGAPMLVPTLSQ